MVSSRAERIQTAVCNVQFGVSEDFASRRWNVPVAEIRAGLQNSTIRHRIPRKNRSRVPRQDESRFVGHILKEEETAKSPMTPMDLVDLVYCYLSLNGDTAPLEKDFVANFLHRNPEVELAEDGYLRVVTEASDEEEAGRQMDCDSDDSENPNSLIPFVSQFPFLVVEHESEDDGSDEADDSDVETEVIEPQ
ncbi:unnamed protein product [Clonostachys chloroleuca]|uniref:Uncharacterized protein n=1 Tax=Clonostachys chloroleuca TaxID=1926264 RepID=A0AA35LUU9_9HYPO|nr:unnamed protein product [Clonostachys chloroleuca]